MEDGTGYNCRLGTSSDSEQTCLLETNAIPSLGFTVACHNGEPISPPEPKLESRVCSVVESVVIQKEHPT